MVKSKKKEPTRNCFPGMASMPISIRCSIKSLSDKGFGKAGSFPRERQLKNTIFVVDADIKSTSVHLYCPICLRICLCPAFKAEYPITLSFFYTESAWTESKNYLSRF